MSLFEKIELEPIEPEEPADISPAPRQRGSETLTVVYPPWKKVLTLLVSLLILPMFYGIFEEGLFAFEVVTVAALLAGAWYLSDCLLTDSVTFSPDSIVKTGVLGTTVLPAAGLIVTANEQSIRFVHGSARNIREAVTIHRFIVTSAESADILAYAEDLYHGDSTVKGKDGAATQRGRTSTLAIKEYDKSVASYRMMAAFFVVFALIAIFTIGLSDNFTGIGHGLPSFPLRLVCIGLATGSFLLLRRLTPTADRMASLKSEPISVQLQKIDSNAFIAAVTTNCVAGLGLVLFLLFGNTLDLYLFLLVGMLYFYDCYPRLSTWENTVRATRGADAGSEGRSILPRRSLQVSVVLMGALAVLSYGESSHYLYANRKDCLDDWGDRDCREVSGGGGGRYYGPRYGSSGGRAGRSIGVASVSRGGFGSLGSFHASFGG